MNTSDFGANVFDENQQPRTEASEDAAASGARPKKRGARRKKGADPERAEPADTESSDARASDAGPADVDRGFAGPEARRDAPPPPADFDAAPPAFREELPPPPLRSVSANPWAEPTLDAEPSAPPTDEAPARDGTNPRRRRRRGRGEREFAPTSESGPTDEPAPAPPRDAAEPADAAAEFDSEPRAPVFGREVEVGADGDETADLAATEDEGGERGAETERGSDADGGARRRRRRRRRGRRGDRDDRAVAGEVARPAAPFGGEPLADEDGPASEDADEDGEREAEPRERADSDTESDTDAEVDAVDARSRGVEGERPEFRESERRERGGRERFESRDRRDRDRDREVRRERPPVQPRIARPPIHVPTHESETRGARLAILIDLAHVEAQARALDREIAWGRLVVWLGKRRHVVRCIAYASADSASRVRSTLLGNGIDVNVVADARLIPVAIAVDAMNLASRVDAVVLVPGSDELEPMTRALAGHGIRVESADFTPDGQAAETRTQPHHQLGAECLFAP